MRYLARLRLGGDTVRRGVASPLHGNLSPSRSRNHGRGAFTAVVVLVAGASPHMRPLQQQTWETFSANWQTDVRITFHWLREVLLKPLRPGSRVVVFSSGAALNGSPLSGGYAGAKATQRFITAYAQDEAKRAGLDITFTAILPRFAPVTGVGQPAVQAYAARAGKSVEEFLRAGVLAAHAGDRRHRSGRAGEGRCRQRRPCLRADRCRSAEATLTRHRARRGTAIATNGNSGLEAMGRQPGPSVERSEPIAGAWRLERKSPHENRSYRRWEHGRDTCAPPRQARPSRLDCELERTGKPDRVGGRDRRDARFRCRRRQRRRNRYHRDPNEGRRRSSTGAVCERGRQRRRHRYRQLPSGASRWPHRCDRPRHARQPMGRAADRPSRDQGVQQHPRREPSRKGRSEGNEGADRSLGRRRFVGRQGSSASPRRRSWLRPCRRW